MEEVVDIEDMQSGISIMDLGLNEFRLDLLEYIKHHDDVEHAPHGMHAVVSATDDMLPGVIFVLRNISNDVNIGNQNRLHPFYMVYIGEDGEVVCDHLSPKELLDRMRLICKGHSEPDKALCRAFNKETKDGRDMAQYSELLSDAIGSVNNSQSPVEIAVPSSSFRTARLAGAGSPGRAVCHEYQTSYQRTPRHDPAVTDRRF